MLHAAGAFQIPISVGLVGDQICLSRILAANGKQGPAALANKKQENLTK
jgi:hypothetical protein